MDMLPSHQIESSTVLMKTTTILLIWLRGSVTMKKLLLQKLCFVQILYIPVTFLSWDLHQLLDHFTANFVLENWFHGKQHQNSVSPKMHIYLFWRPGRNYKFLFHWLNFPLITIIMCMLSLLKGLKMRLSSLGLSETSSRYSHLL